jgi:hypothetical protein
MIKSITPRRIKRIQNKKKKFNDDYQNNNPITNFTIMRFPFPIEGSLLPFSTPT